MEKLIKLITEYAELERELGRLEGAEHQNTEQLIKVSQISANKLVQLQMQLIKISKELLK